MNRDQKNEKYKYSTGKYYIKSHGAHISKLPLSVGLQIKNSIFYYSKNYLPYTSELVRHIRLAYKTDLEL